MQKWMSMCEDLKLLRSGLNDMYYPVETRVLEGDGRTLECISDEKRKFDLVLYSPPYLNNIDYTEVYKLELWLSGLTSTQADFRELRLRTLRSHPSIKFPETDLVDKLPSNGWPRRLRRDLIAVIPNDEDR